MIDEENIRLENAALWLILFALADLHEDIVTTGLKQFSLRYGHVWFMRPKKRDFIKKFGSDYLKLRDALKKDEIIDLTDAKAVQTLKEQLTLSKYFEYAVRALQMMHRIEK